MKQNIDRAIKSESSRFLPHEIFAILEKSARIVRQKQGIAIRALLCDPPIEKFINEDATANPTCLDRQVAFA